MIKLLDLVFYSIYSFARKMGLARFPEVNAVFGLTMICVFFCSAITARTYYYFGILTHLSMSITGIATFIMLFKVIKTYFLKDERWVIIVTNCRKHNSSLRLLFSLMTIAIIAFVVFFAVSTQKFIFSQTPVSDTKYYQPVQKIIIDTTMQNVK